MRTRFGFARRHRQILSKRRAAKHEALHRASFFLMSEEPQRQKAAITELCDGFHSMPGESRSKKSSSIRGILSLGGQSSLGSTRNALARQSNSKSETQRSCVSILARVCRLKSQPHRRQRAASIGCVSPCWSRKRRICGPTRFRGFFFMFRFQNRNARPSAVFKGSEFRTRISLANKQEKARNSLI